MSSKRRYSSSQGEPRSLPTIHWIHFKDPKELEDSDPFLSLPAYQCGAGSAESNGAVYKVALFACEVKMPSTKSGYLSTSYTPSPSQPTIDDCEVLTEPIYWFHGDEQTVELPQMTPMIQNTSLHSSANQSLTGWPKPADINPRDISLPDDPFARGIPYKNFIRWAGNEPCRLARLAPSEALEGSEAKGIHTPPPQNMDNNHDEELTASYPSPGTGFQEGVHFSPAIARLMTQSYLVIVPLSLDEEGTKWYSYILGPVYTTSDVEDHHLVAGHGLDDNMATVFLGHFRGTVRQLKYHDTQFDNDMGDSHRSEEETTELLSKRQRLEVLQGSSSSVASSSEPKDGSSDEEDVGHDETALTLDQSPQRSVQGDIEQERSDDVGAKKD